LVTNVVLSLLERRDYMCAVPGASDFRRAVWHVALRWKLYAWSRYVVSMEPDALLVAEQMMARGVTSDNRVRLPSGEP
jgi:hypothetical protein